MPHDAQNVSCFTFFPRTIIFLLVILLFIYLHVKCKNLKFFWSNFHNIIILTYLQPTTFMNIIQQKFRPCLPTKVASCRHGFISGFYYFELYSTTFHVANIGHIDTGNICYPRPWWASHIDQASVRHGKRREWIIIPRWGHHEETETERDPGQVCKVVKALMYCGELTQKMNWSRVNPMIPPTIRRCRTTPS